MEVLSVNPVINCQHSTVTASEHYTKCSLGLCGGKPSPGWCQKHCTQRTPLFSDNSLVILRSLKPPAPSPVATPVVARRRGWGNTRSLFTPVTYSFTLPSQGPGTELERLLANLGIGALDGCSCKAHADEMDRNGIEWCRKNKDYIKRWLMDAGRERHWALGMAAKVSADRLIDMAIKAVEHNNAKDPFAYSVVISLKSTPDRRERFWRHFPKDWMFKPPIVFDAIAGCAHNTPPDWNFTESNYGAVGCWLSWMTIIKTFINAGVNRPVMVMEDDNQFVEGADQKIMDAMKLLPDDWDILFAGGQHQHDRPPIPFAPGVVRAIETGRTHCLIIHPRCFQWLCDIWNQKKWHVDRVLRQFTAQKNVYAIDPWVAVQAASRSLLMNRYEPARSWDDRVKIPKSKIPVISHSGDVGDLIYGLPAFRAVGAETLVLYPSACTRQTMTPELVESIKTLLLTQEYVKEVRYAEHAEGFDLNAWRSQNYGGWYNLADRQLDTVGVSHLERNMPWLDVEPNPVARVLIHRWPSGEKQAYRRLNPAMPWKAILAKYGKDAVFIGHQHEYDSFCKEVGKITYHPTPDLLELARVIAGAELTIGNQSLPVAMAVAMLRPFVMEVCLDPGFHNCHFLRSNATYILNGKELLPDLPVKFPSLPRVLVVIPRKPQMNAALKAICTEAAQRLKGANPELALEILFDDAPEPGQPGDYTAWSRVTRVRNRILNSINLDAWDFLLWIDADVIVYPADMPSLLLAANPNGISAPLALVDKSDNFYDLAAFIVAGTDQVAPANKHFLTGRNLDQKWPYWPDRPEPMNMIMPMDCVGMVTMVPTRVYKAGARYFDHDRFTDHYTICKKAREMGLPVIAHRGVIAYHARLPDFGEPWH